MALAGITTTSLAAAATSTCTLSTNGLLSQDFTGGGGASYYACAFGTNYTSLASKCCQSAPRPLSPDPCYSWCDLPASMNDAFDNDNPDYYQYMKGCLNSTGLTSGPLWCHAVPHIIINPTKTTTRTPTSTFNAASYCATAALQTDIGVNDPKPACGVKPDAAQHLDLEYCCSPAAVQYSVVHCYEYCALPAGNQFRGVGNLTYDQQLGSFKACLQQRSNSSYDAFAGIGCRVNASEVDLKRTTFGTTQYLTSGGVVSGGRSNWRHKWLSELLGGLSGVLVFSLIVLCG